MKYQGALKVTPTHIKKVLIGAKDDKSKNS